MWEKEIVKKVIDWKLGKIHSNKTPKPHHKWGGGTKICSFSLSTHLWQQITQPPSFMLQSFTKPHRPTKNFSLLINNRVIVQDPKFCFIINPILLIFFFPYQSQVLSHSSFVEVWYKVGEARITWPKHCPRIFVN